MLTTPTDVPEETKKSNRPRLSGWNWLPEKPPRELTIIFMAAQSTKNRNLVHGLLPDAVDTHICARDSIGQLAVSDTWPGSGQGLGTGLGIRSVQPQSGDDC